MVNETILIILTSVCLGVIMCYPFEFRIPPPSNGSGVYCGTALSNVVAFVCQGNYNSLAAERSLRHIRSNRKSRFPFKNHEEAKTFIRSRRRRRGITDECCTKPCSMDELLTFCGK